jgi:hypothetical protein
LKRKSAITGNIEDGESQKKAKDTAKFWPQNQQLRINLIK